MAESVKNSTPSRFRFLRKGKSAALLASSLPIMAWGETRVTAWPRAATTRATSSPPDRLPPPALCGVRAQGWRCPRPLEFPACRRVDQARNPVMPGAAPLTHLVAGNAGADILRAALQGFGGQPGVCDLPPHNAHHIRLARSR